MAKLPKLSIFKWPVLPRYPVSECPSGGLLWDSNSSKVGVRQVWFDLFEFANKRGGTV